MSAMLNMVRKWWNGRGPMIAVETVFRITAAMMNIRQRCVPRYIDRIDIRGDKCDIGWCKWNP